MSRSNFWIVVLCCSIAALLFEPVRILFVTLTFFWIMSIGLMPHVAVMKVAMGTHRR